MYQPLTEDEQGRLISERLGLALVRWQGVYKNNVDTTWLRWATLEGIVLPIAEEIAVQAQEQAAQAKQEAVQAQEQAAQAQEQATQARKQLAQPQLVVELGLIAYEPWEWILIKYELISPLIAVSI